MEVELDRDATHGLGITVAGYVYRKGYLIVLLILSMTT